MLTTIASTRIPTPRVPFHRRLQSTNTLEFDGSATYLDGVQLDTGLDDIDGRKSAVGD